MTVSLVWRVRWRDKIIFYPVQLTLFSVISMQTRNISGVFIQILMTRALDLVTGSNLKRWLKRDNLLPSQVAQATTQTQAEQKCSSNYGPEFTSCCIAESQEHTTWIKICEEKLLDDSLLRIFQSVTFWFQHVGLMRPLPKFGTYEIFANFFPRQKLEIF